MANGTSLYGIAMELTGSRKTVNMSGSTNTVTTVFVKACNRYQRAFLSGRFRKEKTQRIVRIGADLATRVPILTSKRIWPGDLQ